MAEYIAIERTKPEKPFWLFCCRSDMTIKDQAGNNVPFLNQLTGEDESSRRALAPGSQKIINRG